MPPFTPHPHFGNVHVSLMPRGKNESPSKPSTHTLFLIIFYCAQKYRKFLYNIFLSVAYKIEVQIPILSH